VSTAAAFEIDVEQWQGMSPAEQAEAAAELARWKLMVEANPLLLYFPHQGELEWKLKEQAKQLERWAGKGFEIFRPEGAELYQARMPDGTIVGMPPELVIDGNESRGQLEFHEATLTSDVVAAVAGNRFGKSHVGFVDVLVQILPRELIPPWLLQFRRRNEELEYYARAIGVDLGNWLEKAILPKLRKLIPPSALWKGDFDKAFTERTRMLQFADGSWLDFLTHDMDIDSFASADLDHVLFDEEPPGEKGKQQVDETSGRIADRDGRVRWTLTPLLGLSHVYYELTDDQGEPRKDDEVWVVTGDIDHNPHVSERGRRKFLRRFKNDPLKLQARKSGRWVHFAGRIYDEFEETDHHVDEETGAERGHLCPPRPIPREHEGAKPSRPVREWLDPGIATDHPAAFGAAWIEPDGTLEIFHTFKLIGGTAGDMADHIWETRKRFGYTPAAPVVIDPSARNKHHQTGRSTQDEYRKHKIATKPGQNDVEAGINAMKERFTTHRIRLQRDCHEYAGEGAMAAADLAEEWRDYRWKGNKRSSSEDAAKAQPIKKKDDLADGCRYLVMDLRPKLPSRGGEEERPEQSGQQAFVETVRRISRRGRRRHRIGGYV
jgi:hypothetical protein